MATATASLSFPSVEWFEALRAIFNKEAALHRKSGQADTTMAVKSGDDLVQLTFKAFDLTDVRRISSEGLKHVEFYLEQSPEAWQAMLLDIKKHGRAEGQYTLNSIDGNDPDGFARSKADYMDGDPRDAFYRFNQTFQDLFDLSARLDTAF